MSAGGIYDQAFHALSAYDQELNGKIITAPLIDYKHYTKSVADLQTYSRLFKRDLRDGTDKAFDWLASQPSEDRHNLYNLYTLVNSYINAQVMGALDPEFNDMTDDDVLDAVTVLALEWPASFKTINNPDFIPEFAEEMHPDIASGDDTEAHILSQAGDLLSQLEAAKLLTSTIEQYHRVDPEVAKLLRLQTNMLATIIDKLKL